MKLSAMMYRFIVSCERRSLSLRRPVVKPFRAVLLAAALGSGLGACSIAVPMGGVLGGKDDNLTTQSLAPAGAAGMSAELTPDDWNFASIALATALDPLGSGGVAPWANPRTGIRGDFVASGKPYLRNDLVCRDFRATLQYHGGNDVLDGAACRMPDGRWSTTAAAPA